MSRSSLQFELPQRKAHGAYLWTAGGKSPGGAYIAFYVCAPSKRGAVNPGRAPSPSDGGDAYIHPDVCATRAWSPNHRGAHGVDSKQVARRFRSAAFYCDGGGAADLPIWSGLPCTACRGMASLTEVGREEGRRGAPARAGVGRCCGVRVRRGRPTRLGARPSGALEICDRSKYSFLSVVM